MKSFWTKGIAERCIYGTIAIIAIDGSVKLAVDGINNY
jgi:hypothetical protein